MAKALDTVDGVGIARTATQEFDLPEKMLEGKESGAIKTLLDQNDFGLTNMAAGTQIRQVGKDERPIDLSSQENWGTFQKDMGAWKQKMQADKEGKVYGYIDLSVKGEPYDGAGSKI